MMMDYKLLLDTAVLAGEIMLRNGAEIFRVESTISHILNVSGLKTAQAYVTTTGIMVTLDDPSMDSLTVIKRITNRDTNLYKIYKVNNISRGFCEGNLTLKEAFSMLKHMEEQKVSKITLGISYVVCTATFAVLFGGNLLESFFAGLNGLVLFFTNRVTNKIGLNKFMVDLISSIFIAVFTILCSYIPKVTFDVNPVIIGAIMPIVPGAAITNAIRDTLQGDYTAGGAKALEAFVTATAIAIGVGVGFLAVGGMKL